MPYRTKQHGFSLIEVMVAMIIFAIGLLGVAGLMASNMGFTSSSQFRTQANFLAYDILDRMRTNPTVARTGAYNTGFGDNPAGASCYNTACTPGAIATADLAEWKGSLSTMLPSGQGSVELITVGGRPIHVVRVRWQESSAIEGELPTLTVRSEL